MSNIQELENRFKAANENFEAAAKARKDAALELAQARAEAVGIQVGKKIEYFRYFSSDSPIRAKVIRVTLSQWEIHWGRDCRVHVLVIKKDGTEGVRQIEIPLSNFILPGRPNGEPSARVLQEPAG